METLRKTNIIFVLGMALLLSACGGSDGSATTGSTDGSDTGGDEVVTTPPEAGAVPLLVAQVSIEPPTGSRIADSVLSPDGSVLALLIDNQTQTSSSSIFGDKYTLQVFDSTSGALLRSMNDPGDGGALLDLYWGADRLSLLLFGGGMASWDVASGNVLNVDTTVSNEDCAFLSQIEAFDQTQNLLYAAQGGNFSGVCVINFNTGTATAFPLEKPDTAARISTMALNPAGDQLWISYEANNFNPIGTQVYDAATMISVGGVIDSALGHILAVGTDFQLYSNNNDFTLQPAEVVLAGYDNDATIASNAQVLALHDAGKLRLISMPAALYIGETEQDSDSDRSFSSNGSVGAFVYGDRVDVHELPSPGNASAIELPVRFSRQFAGTLTLDGVDEAISGTCDTDVVAGVGPNIINLESTIADGSVLAIRAQNLLGFISYRIEIGGTVYQHSTTLAQNFSLESPQISTDGTSITGSSLLYTFDENSFLALEADAADPTGFLTRSLLIDGSCSG